MALHIKHNTTACGKTKSNAILHITSNKEDLLIFHIKNDEEATISVIAAMLNNTPAMPCKIDKNVIDFTSLF